jgi:choline monooxygenase
MSVTKRRDAAREAQRPGPNDRGLPNSWFIDEDHYRTEQELLFRRTWVLAGVEGMLADKGAVIQADVAGVPIFFTRNRAGEIRAFQNVCPHRGVRLVVEDHERAAVITCPYHAWTYDLDGRLRTRTHFFGPGAHATPQDEALHACEGLWPVRTASWNGALLVNIDGKAPPLEDYVAPLAVEAEGYDLSGMRFAGMVTSTFEANWKLTIENFLDVYHVFAVHPTLDSMMTPDQRKSSVGSGYLIYSDFYSTDTGKQVRDGLTRIPNLPEELANISFFGVMFPNWMISIHPTYLLHWHVVPLSVERTCVNVYAHFVGEAATNDHHAEARRKLLDYYVALNAEDEDICRRLQQGRQAPAYDGGRFSPYWDGGTVHLANLVRAAMEV